MELTKEHFDQALKAALAPLATTEELRATERRLMKHADDMQAELARMVSAGFHDIQARLDVREQVARHQKALEEISKKVGLHFQL